MRRSNRIAGICIDDFCEYPIKNPNRIRKVKLNRCNSDNNPNKKIDRLYVLNHIVRIYVSCYIILDNDNLTFTEMIYNKLKIDNYDAIIIIVENNKYSYDKKIKQKNILFNNDKNIIIKSDLLSNILSEYSNSPYYVSCWADFNTPILSRDGDHSKLENHKCIEILSKMDNLSSFAITLNTRTPFPGCKAQHHKDELYKYFQRNPIYDSDYDKNRFRSAWINTNTITMRLYIYSGNKFE